MRPSGLFCFCLPLASRVNLAELETTAVKDSTTLPRLPCCCRRIAMLKSSRRPGRTIGVHRNLHQPVGMGIASARNRPTGFGRRPTRFGYPKINGPIIRCCCPNPAFGSTATTLEPIQPSVLHLHFEFRNFTSYPRRCPTLAARL